MRKEKLHLRQTLRTYSAAEAMLVARELGSKQLELFGPVCMQLVEMTMSIQRSFCILRCVSYGCEAPVWLVRKASRCWQCEARTPHHDIAH